MFDGDVGRLFTDTKKLSDVPLVAIVVPHNFMLPALGADHPNIA